MFRNLRAFTFATNITPDDFAGLNSDFEKQRFVPCGPSQEISFGWVEPRGRTGEKFIEVIDGRVLVKLCVESKKVPPSVITDAVTIRIADILKETGRTKMGRKEKAELKEEVKLDLIVKAFPVKSYISLWACPSEQMLFVDSTSAGAGDRIITAFLGLIAETSRDSGREASAAPIQTKCSPDGAMGAWLLEQEAPAPFDLGRECELAQTNGTKTKVRYVQHALEIDEIVEHIKAGMRPTKLQLTLGDDVTFVLGADLCLRNISVLLAGDVAMEQKGDEDSFDATFCIMAKQTVELMKSVLECLNVDPSLTTTEAAETGAAMLGSQQIEGALDSGSGAPRATPSATSHSFTNSENALGAAPERLSAVADAFA